jgi:hypothetical protein
LATDIWLLFLAPEVVRSTTRGDTDIALAGITKEIATSGTAIATKIWTRLRDEKSFMDYALGGSAG